MKLSNYIELAIMFFLIICAITLLIYFKKKISNIECDCEIHKGSDIKGERIDKIDELNCGDNKNE